jgi:predicted membrane protein (TIGR00267 family)
MMRFELGLEEPDPKRALTSAMTIGLSYIAGGSIPLAPYFFVHRAASALLVSIALTLLALMVFGYVKARLTGAHPVRGAFQTVAIGGIAAAAAFAIAKAVS